MTQQERMSKEYAERVCNGEFPITYSKEQVVKHTANDFLAGWEACEDANKKDWFNAGCMAERIIWKDKCEALEKRVKELEETLAQVYSYSSMNQNMKVDFAPVKCNNCGCTPCVIYKTESGTFCKNCSP